MRPYIVNGLVDLHAPLPHPERIAAGIADVSDCELRYEPFRPWSAWKLLGNLVCAALLFGAIMSPLWWG